MKSRIIVMLAILLVISIVFNLKQYHERIISMPGQEETKNHYDLFKNRLYHTDQSLQTYHQAHSTAAQNKALVQAAGYAGEAVNEIKLINASAEHPQEQPLLILESDIIPIHTAIQHYAVNAAGGHHPDTADINQTSEHVNELMKALQHTSLHDEQSLTEIQTAAEAVNSRYRE